MAQTEKRKYYTPINDYCFKRIFGDVRNIDILAAFLKAALDLPDSEFDSLEIIDPQYRHEKPDEKPGTLDIRVKTKSGYIENVEMQVQVTAELRNRIVLYACRLITQQLNSGDKYGELKKAVNIIICKETLIKEEESYYNKYTLKNGESGKEFSGLLAVHILDLSKVPAESDGTGLFEWTKVFTVEDEEEYEMIAETTANPAIKKTVVRVHEFNADEKERAAAEWRAKERWEKEAMKRDGIREGIEKGIEKNQRETVQRMKARNYPLSVIVDATGLTETQIAEIN